MSKPTTLSVNVPAPAAPKAIEAIPRDHCIDQADGYVTATIDDAPGVFRDGACTQPAQVGDVLSMQPDGTIQARPAGTNGAYELAKPSGAWLVYRPKKGGRVWLHPLATEWPNV